MRILGPELAASGFVVEIDYLLDSISNIIVVLWLVVNDHVAFFELHSLKATIFEKGMGGSLYLVRSSMMK